MLPHGLDADCVARSVFDHEIFAPFGGDLIGGSLCAPDCDARLQSADHVHGDTVSLRCVVTEAIGNPDIGRSFQICRGREIDLKVRREHSDDSRTKEFPLI